jgi:hypothetical protein
LLAKQVELDSVANGYTRQPASLPPAPSAAMPLIPTKPLERMVDARPAAAVGEVQQVGFNAPAATEANPVLAKSSDVTTPVAAKTPPDAASMQPAVVAPAPRLNPSIILDGDHLPAWMLDGLMQTERSSPSRLPSGNAPVLPPAQK